MHLRSSTIVGLVQPAVTATLTVGSVALAAAAGLAGPVHAQAAAARGTVPGAPAGVTAFVNVGVVPMDTERVLTDRTVLVEGGRITALGPVNQVKVPAGATRIDGQGRYLIPGLGDMHAHLNMAANPEVGPSIERDLLKLLASGVTTVRNMDYSPDEGRLKYDADTVVLRLRADAAAGTRWSPRIYTAGAWVPAPHYIGGSPSHPAPLDSVAFYVAAYQAKGFDFLKIHDERPAVYDSVLAAARRLGLAVEGHVPDRDGRVPLARALTSGQRSIEHLTGYLRDESRPAGGEIDGGAPGDTARIGEIAAATRRAGVWNCPTLAITRWREQDALKNGYNIYVPHAVMERWVKTLQDAGAGLLLGTDAYGSIEITVHDELEVLVEAGLTPYQALLTGTRNVAEFLGRAAESGTVAVGKRADLLLLGGNPLQDMRYTRAPAEVMIGGRRLTQAEFDLRMAAIPPGKYYAAMAYEAVLEQVLKLPLTDAQRSVLRPLYAAHQAQQQALRDSLGSSGDRVRRQLALVARQISEFRAALTPTQQAVLDPQLQVWQAARAAEGYLVAISGLGQ